jgi:hypothetical protein
LSELGDEAIDERTFSGAGRSGDADQIRAAGVREDGAHQLGALRIFVFDEGNGARDRARIACEHTVGQSHRASS